MKPSWRILHIRNQTISIGQCYIAMAKGGLTPDHVLILPIAHHSSSLDLPEDTRAEADKFKQALMDAFYSEGRPCVIFERNYRTDHMQIQVRNRPVVCYVTGAFHDAKSLLKIPCFRYLISARNRLSDCFYAILCILECSALVSFYSNHVYRFFFILVFNVNNGVFASYGPM